MVNFSQLLAEKKNDVLERWMQAVKQDRHISSDNVLSSTAVRNHIPRVLDAMVSVLSRTLNNDLQSLVEASLDHGVVRAEQGFSAAEIAREYRLLRRAIFVELETELLQSNALEVFRVFRIVDAIVDEAIAQCFKSYVDERLRELEQVQHQLSLTNQELTRLVHTHQDNLSHLAHEFKTPLNSIIGYSELLLRQQHSPQFGDNLPSIDSVERVLRNGRQMLQLVNDVLEISRYDSGKMQLHPTVTNVRGVLQNAVEMIAPLANDRNLQLKINDLDAPTQVLTDPLRLQQIVVNLLSNAVRYTEIGSVTITCQLKSSEEWLLSVADTGIGIAPEEQSHIFDPYYRVKTSQAPTSIDGTGLGLAIVARLVHLLQGKIELVSQVGIGSSFTLTLPLKVQILEDTIATVKT
jgi:signal transduction histidine kinase